MAKGLNFTEGNEGRKGVACAAGASVTLDPTGGSAVHLLARRQNMNGALLKGWVWLLVCLGFALGVQPPCLGQSRFAKTVNTIAELKALNTADVYTNVLVLGYYTPNDGGGDTFYWDSTVATSSNKFKLFKGKTTAAELATGRWVRNVPLGEGINILKCGARGDGATDDTAALTEAVALAGTNQPIYFPAKIGATRTVYYFSGTTDFAGATIRSDGDMAALSVANSTGILYRNARLLNDVRVINRGKSSEYWLARNVGEFGMFKRNAATSTYGALSVLSFTTDFTASTMDYNSATPATPGTAPTLTTNVYTIDTASVATTVYSGPWLRPIVGRTMEMTAFTAAASSSGNLQAVICDSSGSEYVGVEVIDFSNSLKYLTYEVNLIRMSGGARNRIERKAVTDKNWMAGVNGSASHSVLIGVKMVAPGEAEFYVNNTKMGRLTFSNGHNADRIFFGFNGAYSGVASAFKDPVAYTAKNMSEQRPLRVAIFGDSLAAGSSITMPWPELLPMALEGRPGVGKVTVTNYGVSGHTAADQEAIMSGVVLTNYDVVGIEVGINDMVQGVTLSTFDTKYGSMLAMCAAAGRPAVCVLPPMFVSGSTNDVRGEIRGRVQRLAAIYGARVSDSLNLVGPNFGTWGVGDNIHPDLSGNMMHALSFANEATAIFAAIQPSTLGGVRVVDGNLIFRATAAPTTGWYPKGTIVENSDPDAGEAYVWVCTAAGAPGTWTDVGTIGGGGGGGGGTAGTVIASGTATVGQIFVASTTSGTNGVFSSGVTNLTLTTPTLNSATLSSPTSTTPTLINPSLLNMTSLSINTNSDSSYTLVITTTNASTAMQAHRAGSSSDGAGQTVRILLGSSGAAGSGLFIDHLTYSGGSVVRTNSLNLYNGGIALLDYAGSPVLTADTQNKYVGIVSAFPAFPFDVNGAARFRNALRFGGSTSSYSAGLDFGAGTPEAAVTEGVGSFYLDTTGGAPWAKITGTGNTGWEQTITTSRTLTAGAGLSGGGTLAANRTFTWDPSTFVNNVTMWDASQASRTWTANLSGATDPVITFGNNSIDFTTGVLKYGGNTVATLSGGAVPIAQGGTAATTAAGALDALITAEASVASATTTDLGAVTSQNVQVTGTTTITSFGTVAAGVRRWGRFAGALTLTHNATSLILPGGASITTAANDRFMAISLGSGNWLVYFYQTAAASGGGGGIAGTVIASGTSAAGRIATAADSTTTNIVYVATVPVANGGTAATTANGALDNLATAEATVASATTTDLGAVTSQNVQITGTTTITGFGTVAAGVRRWGRFAGALTLTHNATSLILPGGASITTAANDRFSAISLGSGNWLVYFYQQANGAITPAGNILPTVNTTYTLGSGAKAWSAVYADRFQIVSGGAAVFAGGADIQYSAAGRVRIGDNSAGAGSIESFGAWHATASTSANYTTITHDHTIRVDASGGAKTITLLAPASAYKVGIGAIYVVKKTDSSGNAVTVQVSGGANIDGSATVTISSQYAGKVFQSNGTTYDIIGSF